jgi:flagellar export protein FliJ
MTNEYKLQTLLKLRSQEQESAEDEYAREVQELRRREEFVATKRAELVEAEQTRRRACEQHDERMARDGGTLSQIRAFDAYLAGLKADEARLAESIARAEKSVAQQKRDVQKAKQALIEATKELKAVEKHREKWEAEQAAKEQRKRSATMDEVAARRWMERNK